MYALMDHAGVAAAKVRKVPILIGERAGPFGQELKIGIPPLG
jgi:hypothetical protein